ncbi:MAG: ferritin [candidate division Zixibacteria bacterium]|nr:ferritin [candidate division Zixibacteria bacterium]
MMNKKVEEGFNNQINAELHSAYLYYSMSAYFEDLNLSGFASWMRVQAQEELFHASKFYDFICDRGGRVLMQPIDAVDTEWESPLAAFEAAYGHEKYISDRINKLVKLAREEGDVMAENFLQWFVQEQVEEEATADEKVQEIKMVGNQGQGLFMVDRELGQRTFTMPADGE